MPDIDDKNNGWNYISIEHARCELKEEQWVLTVTGRESIQGRRAISFYAAGTEQAGHALATFLNNTKEL